MLLRAMAWTLGVLLVLFVITGIGLAAFSAVQFQTFATAANTTPGDLWGIFRAGWNTSVRQDRHHVNILLLGVDSLSSRGAAPPLTDSIQIVSLDLQTARVALLSLPRDLWHPTYKTKINSFYAYGHDRYPDDPTRFPREVVTELTGVPIHYTVVLDMNTVAAIIDAIGGVIVDVPVAFTDAEFPKPDVDVTIVHDPALLYETVQFDIGRQRMSGERALQYMRSRHAEGEQGTDDARQQRQQLVIFALIEALRRPSFYTDLSRLGRLYVLYQDHFGKSFPITDLIGLVRELAPVIRHLTIVQGSLSIFPDNPLGVIWHPPTVTTEKQWAYTIRDTLRFQEEVRQVLGIEQLSPSPSPQLSGGR